MNSKKRSGSGIFLMEMIMVCGFFLLCAAVCIQVFLKSDSMSRLAREKNQAVLAAESLADAWKVYGREGLEPIFPHPSAVDGDGKSLSKACWDEDWERIGDDDGKGYYQAAIQMNEEETEYGVMENLTINISRDGGHPRSQERIGLLYTLEVKRYIPKGEASHGKK